MNIQCVGEFVCVCVCVCPLVCLCAFAATCQVVCMRARSHPPLQLYIKNIYLYVLWTVISWKEVNIH